MDHVRKILGWLKRQHFWLLCGIAAVVALVCWNSARGKLAKEYEANKSAITSEFNNQNTFMSAGFKANEDIVTRQQSEIDKQIKSVEATWKQLHDRQRKEVLEWPAELSKEFRDYIEKKEFGDDIPRDLRSNYQNYAYRHFKSLPKIVGARVMLPGEGGMGGSTAFAGRGEMMGGRVGMGMEMGMRGGEGYSPMPGELTESQEDYLCEWLDQYLVRDALEFKERPSAIRIWVTQEDLWVYQTLLRIIANTNEAAGADRMSNAAIRSIVSLEVGQPAAANSRGIGRIEITQPPLAAGEPGAAGMGSEPTGEGRVAPMTGPGPGAMSGGMGMRMGPGEGGLGGTQMTPEQEKAMLLAGRYLDAAGKPIGGAADMAGGELGAPLDPAGAPPAVELDKNAPFKRLPIRMVLQMDQRWITHLISECANQPLQVEVTEVRINPLDIAGGASGGGMMMGGRSGEGSYGPGRSGGGYGSRSGGGGGGMAGTGSTLQVHTPGQLGSFNAQPNLATVVIQGMIYIFNEPSTEALQPAAQVVAQ